MSNLNGIDCLGLIACCGSWHGEMKPPVQYVARLEMLDRLNGCMPRTDKVSSTTRDLDAFRKRLIKVEESIDREQRAVDEAQDRLGDYRREQALLRSKISRAELQLAAEKVEAERAQ